MSWAPWNWKDENRGWMSYELWAYVCCIYVLYTLLCFLKKGAKSWMFRRMTCSYPLAIAVLFLNPWTKVVACQASTPTATSLYMSSMLSVMPTNSLRDPLSNLLYQSVENAINILARLIHTRALLFVQHWFRSMIMYMFQHTGSFLINIRSSNQIWWWKRWLMEWECSCE